MNDSFRIGTAFGIPIRMHWSFLFLLLVLAPMAGVPPLHLVWLFLSVLLHELGHGLVARRLGVRVVDITFWPLGGMARMAAMPEEPRVEALVAVAGPAVNLLLAGLGMGLGAVALFAEASPAIVSGLQWFIVMNVLLGGLNLLPAFPMDGGRVLRAWYARRQDWVSATERAVRVGRRAALAMVLLGALVAFSHPSVFLVMLVVALFVWLAGGRELIAVRWRHGLSPFGGPLRGVRPAAASVQAEVHGAPSDPLASGPAQRPAAWEAGPPRGGFSEETIRYLENYRGRLKRSPDEEP